MDSTGWFQLIPVAIAAGLALFESRYDKDDEDSANRKVRRWIGLGVLAVVGLGIYYGRNQAQKEQADRAVVEKKHLDNEREELELTRRLDESLNKTIKKADELADTQTASIGLESQAVKQSEVLRAEQRRGIEEIRQLGRDRYLSGIEISYKPSPAQWNTIVSLYRKIQPGDKETSYYDAPIIAEWQGDRWKIDFEPVALPEGRKWFPYVYTSDKDHQAFDSVIREACIGLLVKFNGGSQIDIEPIRADYPAVVTISKDAIAMTLRPPRMALYLGDLKSESTVIFRGRKGAPTEFRFRSLDTKVIFDETFRLVWTKALSGSLRESFKQYVSNPQTIHIAFRS